MKNPTMENKNTSYNTSVLSKGVTQTCSIGVCRILSNILSLISIQAFQMSLLKYCGNKIFANLRFSNST